MSEDETKALKDKLLEQILTKLEVLDARLQRVESKIEQRGFGNAGALGGLEKFRAGKFLRLAGFSYRRRIKSRYRSPDFAQNNSPPQTAA